VPPGAFTFLGGGILVPVGIALGLWPGPILRSDPLAEVAEREPVVTEP
jgi:hypothetical protein